MRTSAIDRLVRQFLFIPYMGFKQIVSFGAGSDTRYFRLLDEALKSNVVYHEIDFPVNCAQKIARIKQNPHLLQRIQSVHGSGADIIFSDDDTALYSPTLNIHPIDLRKFGKGTYNATSETPILRNLNTSSSTLLISECCLCYLTPSDTDEILQNFSKNVLSSESPLALVLYEPIRPNDSFGRMMVSNLASRGIVLQTLHRFSTLSCQRQRLKDCGFTVAQKAADVDFIWENWISEDEKERVAGLEMMDELEEWHLLAQHYCVAWGWREDVASPDKAVFSEAWADIVSQSANDVDENDIT